MSLKTGVTQSLAICSVLHILRLTNMKKVIIKRLCRSDPAILGVVTKYDGLHRWLTHPTTITNKVNWDRANNINTVVTMPPNEVP